MKTYSRKHGDVLQKRDVYLNGSPWVSYVAVISSNEHSAFEATQTGSYCGTPGEWRIVRADGTQVAPEL